MVLHVDLSGRDYDIYIEQGLLSRAGALIRRVYSGNTTVILTDDIVWPLYGHILTKSLHDEGILHKTLVLPSGEETKNLQSLEKTLDFMTDAGLHRKSMLIAFGGGVIGDLGGFAAGVYMRGIAYAQIPTTLLSQTDSSIGGKTGVNLKAGKNLAGVFHQPRIVISDSGLLSTLTDREFSGGMSEVIKYGAIRSPFLFETLSRHPGRKALSPFLPQIVHDCCDIKRIIVERDELDTGERLLLNFGHTFGHAIEKSGNYKDYTHGEAVSMGMLLAAHVGEFLGVTPAGTGAALESLCAAFGLPVKRFSADEICPYIPLDKKAEENFVQLVLLRKIGDAFLHRVSFHELDRLLPKESDPTNKIEREPNYAD